MSTSTHTIHSSRSLAAGIALLLSIALLSSIGCKSAPLTGRKQLMFIPQSQEAQMGASSFSQILEEEPLSKNQLYIDDVNRVGNKLIQASGLTDYDWEFRVIDSDVQNAFALPGGKVAVYEGIMPICADEAGLATVLSHEIAHVLARHGSERMSQQYAVNGIGILVKQWGEKAEAKNREMIEKAYGVASEYGVILPYSRKHELEADYIGLCLMSKAGYEPAEAARFWERMTAQHAGSERPPEFLSTHPSDETRIAELKRRIPDAVAAAGKNDMLR